MDSKGYTEEEIGKLPEYVRYSIDFVRRSEKLALNMQPEKGFYLAFSGGKDSQCIYHICKLAGVKFEAHYSLTTLDPPELVHFIKDKYPDVIIDLPKKTFLKICEEKKTLPTRKMRFCCSVLKESSGAGFCTIIGIRKKESARRAKRGEIEKIVKKKSDRQEMDLTNMEENGFQCVNGKDKIVVAPILHWTDKQVWNFLNNIVKVEHCCLYDEGFTRLGCLFCPMSSLKNIRIEEKRYPKYKDAILRTIHKLREKGYMNNYEWATDNDIYEWWVSKENAKSFFYKLKHQCELFKEDE